MYSLLSMIAAMRTKLSQFTMRLKTTYNTNGTQQSNSPRDIAQRPTLFFVVFVIRLYCGVLAKQFVYQALVGISVVVLVVIAWIEAFLAR